MNHIQESFMGDPYQHIDGAHDVDVWGTVPEVRVNRSSRRAAREVIIARVAELRSVPAPPMRHRRVSVWHAVWESSIVRGLAVAFVLISCVAVGMLIARVTS